MKFNLEKTDDRIKAGNYFNKLLESESKIEIKKHIGSKTNRQNRYLYACFKVLSDYSGYTVEEIKQIMKMNCDIMKVEKGSHVFLRSISELDSKEITVFIDSVRAFGYDNDCYIFTPEEFYNDQFNIEKNLNI